MNFAQAVSSVFKQYFVFSGRACRSEYWWFALFNTIVGIVLSIIFPVLYWIYALATIIPSTAVLVRRLHDTGKGAWWLLIGIVPLIGAVVLLVFAVTKGDDGDNNYGSDPLLSTEGVSPTGMVIEHAGQSESSPGEARHCTNWGSGLVAGANFCRSCGTAI